jgi:tRNA modification GTPase
MEAFVRGDEQDTIAAIATPIGEGGLSIVRLSGGRALDIAAERFDGSKDLRTVKSHTAHYGRFIDCSGAILDEVVCTVFRAPHSYSAEDTVEISCHGGLLVTKRILESLIEAGARLAAPGEFTRRAFLNGRIDLVQAEAVADLVRAQSDRAQRASLAQLQGNLSRRLQNIRDALVESVGLIELELDFVEEGIELTDKNTLVDRTKRARAEINELKNSYRYGKVARDGLKVALIGTPNAGKSSILNALLNENRAIVTDIPGTTRDFIEERLLTDRGLFKLTDTAGLRETNEVIEKEGIRKTWKIVEESDIIVFVHDTTKPLQEEEIKYLEQVRAVNPGLTGLIFADNKSDLAKAGVSDLESRLGGKSRIVQTSALSNFGVDGLKKALLAEIPEEGRYESKESAIITNGRHYEALERAAERLAGALDSLERNLSGEFIALDVRAALDALGEIVGVVTTESIIDGIFSRFCIGK